MIDVNLVFALSGGERIVIWIMVGCGVRSICWSYGWQASAWPLQSGQAVAAAGQAVPTGRH